MAVPVVIIGSGIGGLSLAAALHRIGWTAQVYEQAPKLREVGAGVGVWPNALQALDELGAGDAVRRASRPLTKMAGCSASGKTLSAYEFGELGHEFRDAELHIVHRAALLKALQDQVPKEWIHTGHRCASVEQRGETVRATFENGATAEGGLVIGADGLKSVVRRRLLGEEPLRYSGQTCFRGIAHVAPDDPDLIREIQGAGERCAICPIDERTVYWWTAHNAPQGELVPQEKRREFLLEKFERWPFDFQRYLRATKTEDILQNDLVDRVPVKSWVKGRIGLLGDAAHPTTPNLGQGANMAIDDAVVLARELAKSHDIEAALVRYQDARLARTTAIVNRSWQFGRMMLPTNKLAVWGRELALKMTPMSVMAKELRMQVLVGVGRLKS